MMNKKWDILPAIDEKYKSQFPEIDPLVLQILYNRQIQTQAQIDEFLNPDYGKDVHDPFLFSQMEKARDRIFEAITQKQKILVYGDYDADGVCATVLMSSILKELGASPEIYIPYRESEGYGLNASAAKEIIKNKIQLVITVDCGIANSSEVAELNEAGVDVIITDHHNIQQSLPAAEAIINPKFGEYPAKEICGTAVAYKVAQALLSEKTRQKYAKDIKFPTIGFEKWFLDLVAISTVTDMMVLKGESRVFLKYGLIVLKKTRRPGLIALFKAASTDMAEIDSHTIGFQIGPRLNAAGRIDHASTSYELLITNNVAEAEKIAQDLNEKNKKRQKMGDEMYQEALSQVSGQEKNMLLAAKKDSWSPSLVGLVAGKITDEFFRPCILIGKNQDGKFVGSGRSIEGFDITLALEESKEYLSKLGGHSRACGFTLKDEKSFEPFIKKMVKLANKSLKGVDLAPKLITDCEVALKDINWKLMECLEQFAPYGFGNEKPLFIVRSCTVMALTSVGQGGNHLKGLLGDDKGTTRQIIGFSFGKWCQKLKPGDKIDIVCQADINQWNGNREIQLRIVDLRYLIEKLKSTKS